MVRPARKAEDTRATRAREVLELLNYLFARSAKRKILGKKGHSFPLSNAELVRPARDAEDRSRERSFPRAPSGAGALGSGSPRERTPSDALGSERPRKRAPWGAEALGSGCPRERAPSGARVRSRGHSLPRARAPEGVRPPRAPAPEGARSREPSAQALAEDLRESLRLRNPCICYGFLMLRASARTPTARADSSFSALVLKRICTHTTPVSNKALPICLYFPALRRLARPSGDLGGARRGNISI